jgi:hypothetical protein
LSVSVNDVFEFRNKEFVKGYDFIDTKVFLQFSDILAIYLKHQFSDYYETVTISPIDLLLFKANGSALFAERDYTYFTDVVPYQK